MGSEFGVRGCGWWVWGGGRDEGGGEGGWGGGEEGGVWKTRTGQEL